MLLLVLSPIFDRETTSHQPNKSSDGATLAACASTYHIQTMYIVSWWTQSCMDTGHSQYLIDMVVSSQLHGRYHLHSAHKGNSIILCIGLALPSDRVDICRSVESLAGDGWIVWI